MKRNSKAVLYLSVASLGTFQMKLALADYVTITYSNTNATSAGTNYFVPSNTLAQVTYAYFGSSCAFLTVTANGSTGNYSFGTQTSISQNLPLIVGPATIAISNNEGCVLPLAYFTVQTTRLSTNSLANSIPSTAVVIPNDNGGPVSIILESSVDMVNWTTSLPGTYGTTASNRFFRVRAQR